MAGLTDSGVRERGRLRVLVAKHYDFVWRVLRRFGLSSDEADDATQEVFAVLAKRVADVVDGAEKSFLFQTARNVASNIRRARARWPVQAEDGQLETHVDPSPTPESLADEGQRRRLLDKLLERLPDDLREVIVLCELESMKVGEAALILGIPVGTTASRLRRARALLAAGTSTVMSRDVPPPSRKDEP
jgi:RNA polymerase sigma-70 factor (ECF subfamily)